LRQRVWYRIIVLVDRDMNLLSICQECLLDSQTFGRTAEFAPLNRELDALTVTLALASLLTYSHIYLQFNDHHINDNTQLIMTKKLQSTAK